MPNALFSFLDWQKLSSAYKCQNINGSKQMGKQIKDIKQPGNFRAGEAADNEEDAAQTNRKDYIYFIGYFHSNCRHLLFCDAAKYK